MARRRRVSTLQKTPAIVVLGSGSIDTARRIQALYNGAQIFGLASRVDGADRHYDNFGSAMREFYQSGTPIIALCAAGIVIRTLASLLSENEASKITEPPVLAVAEDGSAVVPLLGGVSGVNIIAREIAAALGVDAAITTSGELRFGTCLLNPPAGFVLSDIEMGKRFVSDLLAGQTVQIDGDAPWLDDAKLPLAESATRTIRVTTQVGNSNREELLIHPQSVLIIVDGDHEKNITADIIENVLRDAKIAKQSLACLFANASEMQSSQLHTLATQLKTALRFYSTHPSPRGRYGDPGGDGGEGNSAGS